MSRNVLKVDQLLSHVKSGNQDVCILLTHVNVPEIFFQPPYSQLPDIFRRIKNLITNCYDRPSEVTFEITASYNLICEATNNLNVWTGSFNSQTLTVPNLQSARPITDYFEQECINLLSDRNFIDTRLSRLADRDTKWKYSSLISIIFNIQGKVDNNSAKIINLDLNHPRNDRHQAKQITYNLP